MSLNWLSVGECIISIDILLLVQSFLPPKDLLALRRTNRLFYNLTQQRSTWIHAVQNVLFVEGIPLSWIPINKMATRELEHLAHSPSQFMSLMRSKCNETIQPYRTQSFIHRADTSGTVLAKPEIYLLPGGRFMVSAASGILCLWDLGLGEHKAARVLPIAHLDLSSSGLHHLARPVPTPDRDGIRILCRFTQRNTSDTRFSLRVYDIYPAKPDPTFDVVAELDDIDAVEIFCVNIQGPYVAYAEPGPNSRAPMEPGIITVWNYEEHTASRWECLSTNFCVIGDRILMCDLNEPYPPSFFVFDIPPMQHFGSAIHDVPLTADVRKETVLRQCDHGTDFGLFRPSQSWTDATPHAARDYFSICDGLPCEYLQEVIQADNAWAEIYGWQQRRSNSSSSRDLPPAPDDAPSDSDAATTTTPRPDDPELEELEEEIVALAPHLKGVSTKLLGETFGGAIPCMQSDPTLAYSQNHMFLRTTPHYAAVPEHHTFVALTAIPAPPQAPSPSSTSTEVVVNGAAALDSGGDGDGEMPGLLTVLISPFNDNQLVEPDSWDVCPATGRAVSVTWSHFHNGKDFERLEYEIRVSDYLLPPSNRLSSVSE